MKFIVYLFLLLIVELMVFVLSTTLDEYCKYKKFWLIKSKKFFIKSKHIDKDFISIGTISLQIFNYIYIFLYISLAFIDSFIFESTIAIFYYINIYSIIPYGVIVLLLSMVIALLYPKEGK